jgi:two-component system, NarL family, invasion response regulator UvrY
LMSFPQVKLLGLSVSADYSLTQQLLKLGVLGFISKASPAEEMVMAIRAVAAGNLFLSPAVSPETDSPFSKLSKRERDVARLILQGLSIQQIAGALALNPKTVNTYRYRLYAKLQIKNDVELTRLAAGKQPFVAI